MHDAITINRALKTDRSQRPTCSGVRDWELVPELELLTDWVTELLKAAYCVHQ